MAINAVRTWNSIKTFIFRDKFNDSLISPTGEIIVPDDFIIKNIICSNLSTKSAEINFFARNNSEEVCLIKHTINAGDVGIKLNNLDDVIFEKDTSIVILINTDNENTSNDINVMCSIALFD